MKKEQPGPEDARRREPDDESEHEKNRRIKSAQDRILRKRLCHLRAAESDGIEAEGVLPPRFEE
jgi:hypothetical protein